MLAEGKRRKKGTWEALPLRTARRLLRSVALGSRASVANISRAEKEGRKPLRTRTCALARWWSTGSGEIIEHRTLRAETVLKRRLKAFCEFEEVVR
jgi:hypothetical protein